MEEGPSKDWAETPIPAQPTTTILDLAGEGALGLSASAIASLSKPRVDRSIRGEELRGEEKNGGVADSDEIWAAEEAAEGAAQRAKKSFNILPLARKPERMHPTASPQKLAVKVLRPGMVLLRNWLSPAQQTQLVREREIEKERERERESEVNQKTCHKIPV